MTTSAPRDVLVKVRRLVQLASDLRRREHFEITHLTILKSLCREHSVANRFVAYLASKTLGHVRRGKQRNTRPKSEADKAHRRMMADALVQMEGWMQKETEVRRRGFSELLGQMRAEQNEHRQIPWGSVRIIHDSELLLFEYAVSCMLHPASEAGWWAYQTARHYAERYDSHYGMGLIPASAPLVQDIADFCITEFGFDRASIASPAKAKKKKGEKTSSTKSGKASSAKHEKVRFTHRQGQFLAFIHLFRKIHRQGPAEMDMVKFFRITPPAVHGMIVKLTELGLVASEPGVARSVRVAILENDIPDLEDTSGPPR